MTQHLMLVPSLACPAGCAYCFGPHAGGATMSRKVLESVVRWQGALEVGAAPAGDDQAHLAKGTDGKREITFHGGEPLVPGGKWYGMALPLLSDGFAPRKVSFAIQSNLWLLTDELCELFHDYGVSVGTSLDGPEAINDAQRGKGYFARTMAGIERARSHGLEVGCICTFTAQSAPRANEIFDFFVAEGLSFSVHAAVSSLRYPDAAGWSLPAAAHGELMAGLLDRYLDNLTRVRIGTLDSMCRSVSAGRGGICTFGDCLGGYLAVGPDGAIYPCQRFAGMPEFVLGDVATAPSAEALKAAPVWRMFAARQRHIAESCGDCSYLAVCRGGCPYNALIGAGGVLESTAPDPHCEAYRRTFATITERALAEVFAPENMEAVVARSDPEHGLMRHGRLLSLMREGPHPSEAAGQASGRTNRNRAI
ncbi:MAG: TIGR04083 family peptide-modifying radical SAM enzyme [Candidatus Limnocylindrales bacterium]